MSVLFIAYPKCSTCQKARKFLQAIGADFAERHIKEENPTAQELMAWHQMSGLPMKRFVNTSGMLYRSMNLKEKLPSMSEAEICALLATDGMLVKRPLLIGEDFVLTGFREGEWREALGAV